MNGYGGGPATYYRLDPGFGTGAMPFELDVAEVTETTTVKLAVFLNGSRKEIYLTVRPPQEGDTRIQSVTFAPLSVMEGETATGTVTLSAPAPQGAPSSP